MTRIVAFGEIMARMAPAGLLRLQQVLPGNLDVTFAGAEANVAASLAMLGRDVEFVTAMPDDNPLSECCLRDLRRLGVGTQFCRRVSDGRFGIYFVETGANQRPGRVYYDRAHSAISLAEPDDFNWSEILHSASWLHLTGITCALSQSAAACTLVAAQTAHSLGVRVSFDVNFRSKLWRWDPGRSPEELAGVTLRRIMPFVSLLIANEADGKLLDVVLPPDIPVAVTPEGHVQRAVQFASAASERYPGLSFVATTLREQLSATHNNWGAMIFDTRAGKHHVSPLADHTYKAFEIRNIADRVGAGDAFDAGLLFGLTDVPFNLQRTLDFATASSCLAHSIIGDTNFASRSEIEELMHGSGSGRVIR